VNFQGLGLKRPWPISIYPRVQLEILGERREISAKVSDDSDMIQRCPFPLYNGDFIA
jgi:hypothetical protein